jgi:hypothetical protein
MPKLSDESYFLPEIFAISPGDVFFTGTTQPQLIRGICKKTQVKGSYVVKYKSSPRMHPAASCSELIASFIAMELDLNVVEPALIEISEEFAESMRGRDGYKSAASSQGINFGCKYVEGYLSFTQNQPLNDIQIKQAQEIFPFDIFISNPDRRLDKPNMMSNGKKIIIYDHELAFGFILDIIKNPTPWIIGDRDLDWIRRHYFYPVLKKSEHNFDSFVDKFTILNHEFWNKCYKTVPKEWTGSHMDTIRDNLSSLIEHRKEFSNELKRILS